MAEDVRDDRLFVGQFGRREALTGEDLLLPVAPHRCHRAGEDLLRESDSRGSIRSKVHRMDGRVVRPAGCAPEKHLGHELAIDSRDATRRVHDQHVRRSRALGGPGSRDQPDEDECANPHVASSQKKAVVLRAKSAQSGWSELNGWLPFRLEESPAMPCM